MLSSISSSLENPKCPPALGPSTTIASGATPWCLSQSFRITLQAFSEETIGASFTLKPLANLGKAVGSPAPEIIKSTPASIAAFTCSSYCFIATIRLTPITPFKAFSLAVFICFFKALRLASRLLV
ncbi:hypothetical protein D3C73_1300620 [compost metagenome]